MSEGVDSVKEGLCLIWSPKNAITQMTGREGLCLIWSPTNAIYSDRFRTDCLKSKLDCLPLFEACPLSKRFLLDGVLCEGFAAVYYSPEKRLQQQFLSIR